MAKQVDSLWDQSEVKSLCSVFSLTAGCLAVHVKNEHFNLLKSFTGHCRGYTADLLRLCF